MTGTTPVMRELPRIEQRIKPFFTPPDPQLVLRHEAGRCVIERADLDVDFVVADRKQP